MYVDKYIFVCEHLLLTSHWKQLFKKGKVL